MRELVLVMTLIAGNSGIGFAQTKDKVGKTKVAVAFFDAERLRSPDGEAMLQNFFFYLKPIGEIVKRDFPDVELKILKRGELLRLPDRTGLNVQTLQPALGYILYGPGRKRRLLSGVQSDVDFACSAAAFFQRRSPACSTGR
jgi:hypothetical protein